jgi:hypothetical protein
MSFFELGGNTALVFEGNIRVGCPGAPGCTITGEFDCCASTGWDKKNMKAPRLAHRDTLTIAGIITY